MGYVSKIFTVLVCFMAMGLTAQDLTKEELFKILKAKDSLLFNAAFDTCDTAFLNKIFTEDFEFYHDKGGISEGRDAFVGRIEEGCKNRVAGDPQPSKRILVPGSLEVYPMYSNGKLYGAIQHGVHKFEFLNENKEYQKGDIAKFTHVWILDNGEWKVRRELSYDHHLQQ